MKLIKRINKQIKTHEHFLSEPCEFEAYQVLVDCKAALEAKGEPVAYIQNYKGEFNNLFKADAKEFAESMARPREHYTYEPLYTTPPNIEALIEAAIDKHDDELADIKTMNTKKLAQPYIDALIAEIDGLYETDSDTSPSRPAYMKSDVQFVLNKYRSAK